LVSGGKWLPVARQGRLEAAERVELVILIGVGEVQRRERPVVELPIGGSVMPKREQHPATADNDRPEKSGSC
jgi:hypothetical protein